MNNNLSSSQKRNCSIDIFRVLFAVYVVALHTLPSNLEDFPLLYLTIRSFFQFAVPFFLTVSGYYFFKTHTKSLSNFFPYIKKIITTYVFWSLLYFLCTFISWGYQAPVGFIFNCVYSFFLTGSYYHLWYFPALIFALCVSALFLKMGYKKTLWCLSVVLYFLCVLISDYNLLDLVPPNCATSVSKIISIVQPIFSGLFYFCCGQLVNIGYKKLSSTRKSRLLAVLLPLSVFVWFVFIWCAHFFSLNDSIPVTIGLYWNVGLTVLVLLLNPLHQFSGIARKCRYLSSFTYYSHPLFLFLLEYVNNYCFPFSDYWNFPIVLILTTGSGLVFYRINSKFINRFIG